MDHNTATDLDRRDTLAVLRYEHLRNDGIVHARAREMVASQYGYALFEVDELLDGAAGTPSADLQDRYRYVAVGICLAILVLCVVFGIVLG